MEKNEWNKIIQQCADDYSTLKNLKGGSGNITPPRNFVRAWMQTNYQIIKLSGYFYRMFNAYINNPSLHQLDGNLSENK